MTILCLPRPRDCDSRFLKTCAAARPSFKAVSAVTGSTFAVPRTPSVPKIFFRELILKMKPQRDHLNTHKDSRAGWLWHHHHLGRFYSNQRDLGRRRNLNVPKLLPGYFEA